MIARSTYLWICIIIIIAASFIIGIQYSIHYGGTDLRCRIVGSRLLQEGRSPYFFKWKENDSVWLLDPNDNPDRKVNGNVVTPALLFLNRPLAALRYQYIRIGWTVLQYLFLVSAVLLVVLFAGPVVATTRNVLFILLVFLFSNIWFFNIERGQTYALYTFLFSLIYGVYNSKTRNNHLIAGMLGGLCIWIRPLFVCMHIPFVLNRNYQWIIGSIAGFVIGLFIFFLPFRSTWQQYAEAMKYYELEGLGKMNTVPSGKQVTMPSNIEGVSNITQCVTNFNAGGLANIQQYATRFGIAITSLQLIIGFAIVLVCILLPYYRKFGLAPSTDVNKLFMMAFLFYMISELFIIGNRGAYNLVEWVFGVSIIICFTERKYLSLILAIAGVCFMNGLPFIFRFQYTLGELCMLAAVIIFIFKQPVTLQQPSQMA